MQCSWSGLITEDSVKMSGPFSIRAQGKKTAKPNMVNSSFAQQLIYDIIKKIFPVIVNFGRAVLYILVKGIKYLKGGIYYAD